MQKGEECETRSLDFGGHPILHHYNFLMSQRQQTELQREAEHERLAREAQRQNGARFYQKWASRLGIHLENWGWSLVRFGHLKVDQFPKGSMVKHVAQKADRDALQVIDAYTLRREKWN